MRKLLTEVKLAMTKVTKYFDAARRAQRRVEMLQSSKVSGLKQSILTEVRIMRENLQLSIVLLDNLIKDLEGHDGE